MRDLINWQDQEVQHPRRYAETSLGGGLVELVPSPGTVRTEGTPQNAANFNAMDLAAFEAMLIGNEHTRLLCQAMRDIDGLAGVAIDVDMTNTQAYPFNNSLRTVQINPQRSTNDYYVVPEVLGYSGGAVGDIEITGKTLNTFKVAYTGSAISVALRLHVIGGA